MSETKKSFFDKFSSKSNFFMGFTSGIVGLIVIGFFVFLIIFLTGGGVKDGSKVAVKSGNDTAPTAQPTGNNAPPAPSGDLAEITSDDHIRGDENAPITIVEFSDFECPFCSRFHPTVQRIVADYEGQVRWVYKHFPLASIHQEAQGAAEASECAAEIGGNDAFWNFSDSLFENQNRLGRDLYLEIARNTGLDKDDFAECVDEGRYRQKVQDQYNEGLAAGVRGTPGSFINGQSIPGAVPYEQIQAIIESLL